MKKLFLITMVAGMLAGCKSGSDDICLDHIENVAVSVSQGRNLRDAVIDSAIRRRWVAVEASNDVIHCTLVQRSNRVEIDVVLLDAKHYSIHRTFCNIPERKHQAWIGKLQREIAKNAR